MSAGVADCKPCCALVYQLPLTHLLLGDTFHPGGDRLTRQLAEQALIGPGNRVLDIACGRGHSARLLAEEFGAHVTGVDYAAGLLQAARLSAIGSPLAARVRFLRADAEHLPFGAARFDTAWCECALCTFADAPRALAEMRRALVPGGWLALSDVVLNAPLPDALQSALGHALCIAGARAEVDYRALIERAGFTAVRSHDVSSALVDMLRHIEQRLQIAEVVAALQQTESPDATVDAAAILELARECIVQGRLGYGLFLARAPR